MVCKYALLVRRHIAFPRIIDASSTLPKGEIGKPGCANLDIEAFSTVNLIRLALTLRTRKKPRTQSLLGERERTAGESGHHDTREKHAAGACSERWDERSM